MKPNTGLSVYLLSLFGLSLTGVGIYFIFLRPGLLPEDIRFMGLNESQGELFLSLATPWLKNVFLVLGGYIASTGILILFLAANSFRRMERWAWAASCLAGISSIGIMTAINFKINSDFKWWLLALCFVWISAMTANLIEMKKERRSFASAAPSRLGDGF